MIVVSGVGDSGMNTMMKLLNDALGTERVLGEEEVSASARMERLRQRRNDESDDEYRMRVYTLDKMIAEGQHAFSALVSHPWSSSFTHAGVRYNLSFADQLQELAAEPSNARSVVKLYSQALVVSDPVYVDKVVFMVRPPREVVRRQVNVPGAQRVAAAAGVGLAEQRVVPKSPKQYIQSLVGVARWFVKNPTVPTLLVSYHDVVSSVETVASSVQSFLGEGDFTGATNVVAGLSLSGELSQNDSALWTNVDELQTLFEAENFQGVLDYRSTHRAVIEGKTKNWYCTRAGVNVAQGQCEKCQNSPAFRQKLKENAETRSIQWSLEPCAYECAYSAGTHVSLAESVSSNFWSD